MIFKWVIQKLTDSLRNKYFLSLTRVSGWVPSRIFICCLTRQKLYIMAFFYFWASCFRDMRACDPTDVLEQQHQLKQPLSLPLSSCSSLSLNCPFFNWGINLSENQPFFLGIQQNQFPNLVHCQLHIQLCHHKPGATVNSQEPGVLKLHCYKAQNHCLNNTSMDHNTREKMELLKRNITHYS